MSDYIHHDLLFPILKRMPVKTLLQWRCVCKSWKQLIDSSAFILDHLAVQRSRIVVQNQSLKYLLLDPSTLPFYDTLSGPDGVPRDNICSPTVICSVHGVICLSDGTDIFLWNPSIRQLIRIPSPENPTRWCDLEICGFWIDPSTNEFKIVIVNFYKFIISLYSSREEVWMEIDIVEDLHSDSGNSVLIEGVNHWIASITDSKGHVIVFFDFVEEKFGTIQLPELPMEKNVCKWNDLLSIIHWHAETHKCDFWVMQNGLWSKISSFSLTDDIIEVFHVWEDWGRVLAANRDELVLYDPRDGCIPLCLDLQNSGFYFAIDFVESFVFPYRKCISSGSL